MDHQNKIIMKVLIAGATGFIGSKLTKHFLDKGYTVNYLTTRKEKIKNEENLKGFFWDPYNREVDNEAFEGVEVIINLAGKSINSSWNKEGRKDIFRSRMKPSDTLYNYLKENPHQVKQVISASAVGIYRSDKNRYYKEDTQALSNSFLGRVCATWEMYNTQFETIGIPSTVLRLGLVCNKDEGVLKPFVTMCKYFFAGNLGSGNQWYSWIHIDDVVRMIDYCIDNQLVGTYNAVAPEPLKQRTFIRKIAKKLKRPITRPPIPSLLLILTMGGKYRLITDSQKVSADKILSKGFSFNYPTFDSALDNLYGKK